MHRDNKHMTEWELLLLLFGDSGLKVSRSSFTYSLLLIHHLRVQ